jgi:hypothetical protein
MDRTAVKRLCFGTRQNERSAAQPKVSVQAPKKQFLGCAWAWQVTPSSTRSFPATEGTLRESTEAIGFMHFPITVTGSRLRHEGGKQRLAQDR